MQPTGILDDAISADPDAVLIPPQHDNVGFKNLTQVIGLDHRQILASSISKPNHPRNTDATVRYFMRQNSLAFHAISIRCGDHFYFPLALSFSAGSPFSSLFNHFVIKTAFIDDSFCFKLGSFQTIGFHHLNNGAKPSRFQFGFELFL